MDLHEIGYSSGSATSRASTMSSHSSSVDNKLHHGHNCSTNGCTGAIPRTPSFRSHKSHSFRVKNLFFLTFLIFN